MIEFKGKVAVVTGGSRGIGRRVVLELAKNKANVAFNYASAEQSALSLVREAELLGVEVLGVKANLRSQAEVRKFIQAIKDRFGDIDFLVNNAGILRDRSLMFMSQEEWDDVIDVNLSGVYRVTRELITGFLKQGYGSIVNISSTAGLVGNAGQSNYSASKAGVVGFSKALAKEAAPYNVRVNVVAPGYVDTDMLLSVSKSKMNSALESIPMKRIGSPDDVASAVVFFLSDMSKYVTGQVLPVDGGLVI